MPRELLKIYDSDGALVGVQLSIDLWRKLESFAAPFLNPGNEPRRGSDIAAFEEFMRFWDFPYVYDPSVQCPGCNASTDDWRHDPDQPFRLDNANIGGLLVFHCNGCGGTIRHKHFRDHKAIEFSQPAGCGK